MQVRDIMTKTIVSVADLLRRYELGTQREVGEKPWWRRLFADEDAPWSYVEAHAMRVQDIMTTPVVSVCLLYTSDAADERSSVDLGGRRIIKKKKKKNKQKNKKE